MPPVRDPAVSCGICLGPPRLRPARQAGVGSQGHRHQAVPRERPVHAFASLRPSAGSATSGFVGSEVELADLRKMIETIQ